MMLTEIFLRNYILIKELRLKLNHGMTALTGETGAGKSILVGALNLVFGKTTPQQIAHDPTRDTYLELTFNLEKDNKEVAEFLESIGFPVQESELIIAREFSSSGKSTSFLNGRKSSIAILKELHDLLIDFHHQRDQQKLLNQAFQLDILDQYGSLMTQRYEFQQLLQELKSCLIMKKQLEESREKSRQLTDLYRFQLDELTAAGLQVNEDTELEQEFNLLSHTEDIISLSGEVYQSIYEQDNSLYDTLSQAVNQIRKYTEYSPGIGEICTKLDSCLENIQEAGTNLRSLREQIASDPERLNAIRQRLDLINNLKTKYRQTSMEGLRDYLKQIEESIKTQDSSDEEIKRLSEKIEKLFISLTEKAEQLTTKRREAAGKLSQDVLKNIKQLAIPYAKFEIKIDKKAEDEILLTNVNKVFTDSGQDTVDFWFTANPGSPVQSLKAIASGGELSRILLAVKQSLAKVMPPRTIILDEIDAGIGGKTAGALAEFIHRLAGNFQVICITHLAKIAAGADFHLLIEKKAKKADTAIEVRNLENTDRIDEIARMLSGHITELSVRHARELLSIK